MSRLCCLAILLVLSAASAHSQELTQFAKHFAYDRSKPLELQTANVEKREGVQIHDLSYASPKGGRVPAYLVVPDGKGPFAAIVWAHWAMRGSPFRNRREFLEEAVVYARSGVVSLLPDAPFARPGYTERDYQPFSEPAIAMQVQQVVDVRRGLDLLLSRADVDPRRVGYVGHSFNAAIGGILTGIERRIKTFVLMAGGLSDRVIVESEAPMVVEFRKQVGEEELRRLLQRYQWADAGYYLARSAPAAIFIQAAREDGLAGQPFASRYLDLINGPAKLGIYEASHALDAVARRERAEWLAEQLRLKPIPQDILDKVPPTT